MKRTKPTAILSIVLLLTLGSAACQTGRAKGRTYVWENVTRAADFPVSYNFPVFIMRDGAMLALNRGGWKSRDGRRWTKTALGESGLNSAHQKFVQLGGDVYALGAMTGNYENFSITSKILRTRDGESWETVAEKSDLPRRVFYGATVFRDRIWLVGGFDGRRYFNDVWSSADGVEWTRVAEKTAWTPRGSSRLVVFRDRLWLIGGGVIDGEKTDNPNSENEIWSTTDGVEWTRAALSGTTKLSGTPVVFDNRLWLVGANRNDGDFASASLVSDDGASWREQSAPWTPRGAVAVWVANDRLFMTGGKYSFVENGETKFVYSNDVWTLRARESAPAE